MPLNEEEHGAGEWRLPVPRRDDASEGRNYPGWGQALQSRRARSLRNLLSLDFDSRIQSPGANVEK